MTLEQRITLEFLQQQAEQAEVMTERGYRRLNWLLLLIRINASETATGIFDTDNMIIRFYANKYDLPTVEHIHERLYILMKDRREVYANWAAWYSRRRTTDANSPKHQQAIDQCALWSADISRIEARLNRLCAEYPLWSAQYFANRQVSHE